MDGQVTSFTGGLYPGGSNTRPPPPIGATLLALAYLAWARRARHRPCLQVSAHLTWLAVPLLFNGLLLL